MNVAEIVFDIIALLFALSVHESAHAWMANRCGDPTAKLLGRITLNPIKHIDPFGTLLFPALLIAVGFPPFGWAKPTPVDTRHFEKPIYYDILTSVAGPVSNFLICVGSVLVMLILIVISSMLGSRAQASGNILQPLFELAFAFLQINVVLAIFNLIPLPPLDGSHVLRHFLPEGARRMYDMVGTIALFVLFMIPVGGSPIGSLFLSYLVTPVTRFFLAFLPAGH